MSHPIRRLAQVMAATALMLYVGATAAFAGPPPIEPVSPPAGRTGSADSGAEFPWLLAAGAVLLAIATVALVAVAWHRAHATNRRLVTP